MVTCRQQTQDVTGHLVCVVIVWTQHVLTLLYLLQHLLVESEVEAFALYQRLHQKPQAAATST